MKAIILSAGQGSRLLPLTNDRPKCLLPVGEKSVLDWQVSALNACGVDDILVVTGFRADLVDADIQHISRPNMTLRTAFNPFFKAADNLATCWLVRHEMDQDFVIINGDTLFEPAIFQRLMEKASCAVNVTIDQSQEVYDADDMKVSLNGDKVSAISKMLPPERTHAESIGMILFQGDGPALFRQELEATMRSGDGLNAWYLQAISRLSEEADVGAVPITGLEWGEIDVATDLEAARKMVSGWDIPDTPQLRVVR